MSQSPSEEIVEYRLMAAATDVVLLRAPSAVTPSKINVLQGALDDHSPVH
jgi:hypothetical protein